MNYQVAFSTIYIYNYHSINIIACLIILALQQVVGDNYLEPIPYIQSFIKYSLILLIVLNTGLLIKSFINKTYTSINEGNKDIFQIMSYMLMLTFKVCLMMLTLFLWIINSSPNYINSTVNIIIGVFFVLYCICYLLFLYFSIHGIRQRIKQTRIGDHWVFDYLTEKQIRSIKTFQEEGKVIGLYFKNFHMNEKENELTFRGVDIKLNSFKFYIEGKKCKIDELTADDIAIMEMLGI